MTRTVEELELIASIAMDLPVGVWVARVPGGELVFANRLFAEILGIGARDDVAAGTYAQPYGIHDLTGTLYPEENLPFSRAMRERKLVVIDDIVIHRPDGSRRNIRARGKPIFREDGEIGWIAVTFNDVTREFDSERARHESEIKLLHAQKMESVGNLAGGVAHDFNNMLTSIKMLVSLMEVGESDPAKLENLARLSKVTDSAVQLTRSLLGLARRGKGVLRKVPVDEVIGAVAEVLRRTLDSRVVVDLQLGAKDATVIGDASQIEQVLLNLAVNARDAMPGGGRLSIRTGEIDLDESLAQAHPPLMAGRHVLLEVADTGTGIDPGIRSRIFEPYFTTRNSGPNPGTGLGLATVYGIIATHHGAIEVMDAVPRGTVMQVLLPAAGVRDEPLASAPARPELILGSGTVLLVDDDAFVRESSGRALKHLGYEVVEARDGDEALSVFRGRHADLVAVLLDVAMPRMPSSAVCRSMNEIDASVPVVLVTGYSLDAEARRGVAPTARAFLSKPFDIAALSRILHAVTQRA